MEATARFAELLSRPTAQVPLDEAVLLVAAHAYPALDIGRQQRRLDLLADRCPQPSLDALVEYLFVDLGFSGNARDYYDPRNSYLNDVLDRRTGIPLTLAVLAMEVGRRLDVPLVGVGMPGHFLLRHRYDDSTFVDPFGRGRLLDRCGCEAAFHSVHGERAPFDPAFLDPVDTPAIVARLLANLRATFTARGNRRALAWTLRLRTLVPGIPAEERAELATVLAARGQFEAAAGEYDTLAAQLGGELGDEYHRSALRLRARLN
jgi:regulator of sirC expression with transglutaminase-like and TPR domain